MKKVPIRRCVGCGEGKPKKELVRVVRSPEGTIGIDATGKQNGRGAYLCPDAACLAKATKKRSLERALETSIPDEVSGQLEEQLAGAKPVEDP